MRPDHVAEARSEARGDAQVRVGRMRVDSRKDPLGIAPSRPRFSWVIEAGTSIAVAQCWFQIVVRDDRDVMVWDSGYRDGTAQFDGTVHFDGTVPWFQSDESLDLEPLRGHAWTIEVGVKVNNALHPAAQTETQAATWVASGVAQFTTGPATESDWGGARWITAADEGAPGSLASPVLSREIDVDGSARRALLVVAAGGYADVRIDGQLITPDVLSPGFTHWNKRVQSVVYDVTSLMPAGRRVLTIELGRGFYGMTNANVWSWQKPSWHAEPSVRALLRIEHADGSIEEIPTDTMWAAQRGSILLDDLYGGEVVDLRRVPGGADADAVGNAVETPGPAGAIVPQTQQPIRVVEELAAVGVTEPVPGEFVVAFPRVIAGWVRVLLNGPAGDTIQLRYGERLRADGLPNADDDKHYFEDGFQTDRVTLDGRDDAQWQSRFSYKGFRYVQVSGWPDAAGPALDDLVACVVHTDAERTSAFTVEDPLLQWIHDATVHTMENNLHGVPTDTPKYEKNGWTGDAMVGADMFLTNLDAKLVLEKWVGDVAETAEPGHPPALIAPNAAFFGVDAQAPVWHAALILVPWDLYRHTGDTAAMRAAWPTIRDYLQLELRRSPGGIADTILGDWVAPGTDPGGGNPPEDSHIPATAYLFRMLDVARQIAEVLELADEARELGAEAERVRAAFIRSFVDEGEATVRGPGDAGYRQTHAALTLAFGIVADAALAQRIADRLALDVSERGDHLDTGAIGTKYLLPVLTEWGHASRAVAVARQRTEPSWGYWFDHGATSMWEHWSAEARSHGHYFLGTVDDWLTGWVGGLRIGAPGWRTIVVDPACAAWIGSASLSVETPYGLASLDWKTAGDRLDLRVHVPVGATAEVHLPDAGGPERVVYVTAGDHRFQATLAPSGTAAKGHS